MAPTVMCCCVFRLRRGCILIGTVLTALYATTCLALAGIAISFYLYDYLGYRRGPARLPPPLRYHRPIALAVAAGMVLLHLVFHVLLLVGARRDRPRLLLAWLVFSGLAFSAQMAALVFGFLTAAVVHDWVLLVGLVAVCGLQALLWHWFLVVRAHYLQLRLKAPVGRGHGGSAKEERQNGQDSRQQQGSDQESARQQQGSDQESARPELGATERNVPAAATESAA